MGVRYLTGLLFATSLAGSVLAGPLQDQINAAGPNSVVEVAPGTYLENITVPDGTFVVATDPEQTILDGAGAASVVELGRDAAIVGFTIRNGKAGINNRGRFVGVFECTVSDFTEYGILIEGGSAAVLHNTVSGQRNATGIGCLAANPYIAYNLIQSNMCGLLSRMNFIPVLEANVFRGNDLAIQVQENSRVLLKGNIFDGNGQVIDGQEPGETDEVRAATADELARLRGGKVEAYRDLMRKVREQAAAMQPRIIYDLTAEPGRFGLLCTFPWSVFTISSVTRDTRIEAYGAFDAETQHDLNAHRVEVHGHPSVAVNSPELVDKVNDRYVSEKIFIHPASLAYQPDGSYVFNRLTNLGRIEVWAPAGFIITSAPASATLATEQGRHVARLLGNGLTQLRVVMKRGIPGG